MLTMSARDETQRVTAPLTTAISTREYEVGGIYSGSLVGPEESDEGAEGTRSGLSDWLRHRYEHFERRLADRHYGIQPVNRTSRHRHHLAAPTGIIPAAGANVGGGVTVGLKPGLINTIPVSKKEFKGANPWIMVDGFHIKIDGCVGESFIRSYAFLTRSTEMSDTPATNVMTEYT
jgi:MspA protein